MSEQVAGQDDARRDPGTAPVDPPATASSRAPDVGVPGDTAPGAGSAAEDAARTRRGRRRLFGVAAASAALASALTAIVVLQLPDRPGPEGVLRQYLTALNEGRNEDALALVADRKGVTADALVHADPAPLAASDIRVDQDGSRADVSYRLGDHEYRATLTRHGLRWLLAEPEQVRAYTVDPKNPGFTGLKGLGEQRLETLDGRAVPMRGWVAGRPGEAWVQLRITPPQSHRDPILVPGRLQPASAQSLTLDLRPVPLDDIRWAAEHLLKEKMTVRAYHDNLTSGGVTQAFAVRDVERCDFAGDLFGSAVSGGGLAVDCVWFAKAVDSNTSYLVANRGAKATVHRGGKTCSVRAPVPLDETVPRGRVRLRLDNGTMKVAWAEETRRWNAIRLDDFDEFRLQTKADTDNGCGDLFPTTDYRSGQQPVQGLSPKDPTATTDTPVSGDLATLIAAPSLP